MPFIRCSGLTFALAILLASRANSQLQPARTIILIGPPGSGKTVQADALQKKYKIPAISMSQLLRKEVNRKSRVGNALAASLDSGELLSDGPANDLMQARLLQADTGRGFILDGYPATEAQAKSLDKWLVDHDLPKPAIVILNVSEEVSRERMTRRRRVGDDLDNIDRRLRDYRDVGRLVEQWYGPERIVRVDGAGAPADVSSRIVSGIEGVHSRQGFKTRSPDELRLKRRDDASPSSEPKP